LLDNAFVHRIVGAAEIGEIHMHMAARCIPLLFVATLSSAQPTSEQISTVNSCNYAGSPSPAKVLAFSSDIEAQEAVKKIVDASGLAQNFQIRAAGVSNAAATIDGAKRYLLYNQTFIQDMQRATGSPWAALSVMAHEVGHHLNGHPLDPNRDPKYEIEADYYSGFILQRLGASLAEAQSAVNYLPMTNMSATHPQKHDRLAAIANGWTKACSETGCNRTAHIEVPTNRSRTAVVDKPVPDGPNSCKYAEDGTCDEPSTCKRGTDTSDCKPRASGPNSCEYSRDGNCDEPDLCDRGTDTADCKISRSPLYCCDAWGRKWCAITANPGPPGAPCYCNGIPGSGVMCQ
jgi:hypothetical protein